ncbi:hypothetical protein [Tenacibaculum jejuense]|uniref:Probable lipoprotein n=1 Tax=Tenacibaculum jejuense TaxID=584609 RepID=A0A238UAQ3_9FLAO|nr:hypothetical protein [Tenacibaculum jejuense]SNR15554.1 Probable lipoprotein precursor [Tenacibaculum jejuense]
MSKFNVLCFLSLLLIFSCSKENETIDNIEVTQTIKQVSNLKERNSRDFGETLVNYDENLLQSVGILFSKVLIKHPNARDYFSEVMNTIYNNGNSVSLIDVLNTDNSINPFLESFEMEYLELYGDPSFNCSRPNEEEEPPTLEVDLLLLSPVGSFSNYLNAILNEHCIELYFPNGIDYNLLKVDFPEVISSAHPLTNASTNESYINRVECRIETSTVDANTPGNVVIARFKRPQGNQRGCLYTEYSFIEDFRTFLSN